jgi:hypothetical protein
MSSPWLATEGPPFLTVVFAAAFAWVSLAVGRRLLLALGMKQGTLAERGVLALALGSGCLQFVPFALGAFGVLGVASVRYASVAIVLAAGYDLWKVALAFARGLRERALPPRWVLVWAAALVPVLCVAGLIALDPTTDPDGLSYHLTVPKRWMQAGALVYLPTYPYSNAPMGAEMLFTLGLAWGGDAAAKSIHFLMGVAGVIGLYLAGNRLRGPAAGVFAATLFLVGPLGIAPVLGCAYVEGAASFAMIAAAVAWILWLESREAGALRCAALLAGFAVTFKITAMLLPAALFALTCLAAFDADRSSATPRRRGVAALLVAARSIPLMVAPIVPWLARSGIVTGNPVFPLFARLIPSRDFTPELSAKFDKWNRYMTWGNVVGRNWTLSQRSHILMGVCLVILAIGAVGIARARSWMGRSTAIVVVVFVLLQASAAGLYVRYSIPLAAVVSLPIAVALGSLLDRRAAPAVLVVLALLGSLAQVKRCLAEVDSDLKGLVRTALGLEDREEFLRAHLGLYPLYEHVNHDLPPDARVMLSCYCGGFYIDRTTYCADMVQTSLRFTSWADFTSDLRRLGITHVIGPRALATAGAPFPPFDPSSTSNITRASQYEMVRPLLVDHGREEDVALDQGLYELDLSKADAP